MSTIYTPAHGPNRPVANAAIAILATAAIFAILPFMGLIDKILQSPEIVAPIVAPDNPPKDIVEELPEKPEEKVEPPKIELEEPPMDFDILTIEFALIPGAGGIGGRIGLGGATDFVPKDDIRKIWEIDEVDRRPAAIVQSRPTYPYSMLQSKTSGSVIVEFVIDPVGKAQRPQVLRSTHRDFETPAIDAVLRSTYSPGSKNGETVSVRTRVTIKFKP